MHTDKIISLTTRLVAKKTKLETSARIWLFEVAGPIFLLIKDLSLKTNILQKENQDPTYTEGNKYVGQQVTLHREQAQFARS